LAAAARSDAPSVQTLMTLFTDEPARFDRALDSLEGGITIDAAASESQKTIVLDRVTA